MGFLEMATHKAAAAAQKALDEGRDDDGVVKAAVKAAGVEIGAVFYYMQDDQVLSSLQTLPPHSVQPVLAVARTALHADNIGGSLPASRADSLYAAFDSYVEIVEGMSNIFSKKGGF